MRAAAYSEPETGVRRMPGGYWMQREYRFALKLPEGWKPSFGPHDKVLFFASGDKHEVFTDNLIVLASPKRDLDLVKLQETLPGEIAQADPKAEIEQCKVVLQGDEEALESVIHIQRGPFKITIFERRFSGKECNYEVRYTLERSAFEKTEKALRKSLESFKEIEGQIPQRGKS